MREKAEIMDSSAMSRAIARISYEIIEKNTQLKKLCVIGILRRGAIIARRISDKIEQVENIELKFGTLDITPFRDDRKGEKDMSDIPFSIEDMDVILVDDVIFTGRSVRAAIDALMSRGRPHSIQFATMIDRGHRELPIRPDFVGKNLPTSKDETVRVHVKEYDGENRVIILGGD